MEVVNEANKILKKRELYSVTFKSQLPPSNSKKVANSIDEFVSLIKMIRKLRPHVKVGVYALPFPVYYDSQLTRNQVGKFDKIFKEVDYIFPSIYIYIYILSCCSERITIKYKLL